MSPTRWCPVFVAISLVSCAPSEVPQAQPLDDETAPLVTAVTVVAPIEVAPRASAASTQDPASGSVRLVKLSAKPAKEEIDNGSNRRVEFPGCEDQDVHFEVDGRKLDLRWEDGAGTHGQITIYEGKKRLWSADLTAAGGPNSYACVKKGWNIIVAGQGRIGETAYEVFTGKVIARTHGGIHLSPDGKWAIAPPPSQWGTSCFEQSRAVRFPLDGGGAHFIATGPVPTEEMDGSAVDGGCNGLSTSVAIAGSGKRYAFAAPWELSVFRASDDENLVRIPNPGDVVTVRFSKSEHYVVTGMKDGSEIWYRLDG